MATDATAHVEKISAEIDCFRAGRYPIFGVALLTASLQIALFKQRPHPMLVVAVRFEVAGRRPPVAPVTTGTTKFVGIVNLQQVPIRMTDKRPRQCVRFL